MTSFQGRQIQQETMTSLKGGDRYNKRQLPAFRGETDTTRDNDQLSGVTDTARDNDQLSVERQIQQETIPAFSGDRYSKRQ